MILYLPVRSGETEWRVQLYETDVILHGVGVVQLVVLVARNPRTLLRSLIRVQVVLPRHGLHHGHVQLVAAVSHGDHHAVCQQGSSTVVPVVIISQLKQ